MLGVPFVLLIDPDSAPEQPKIINTAGKTITVKLTPTPNNNGPVSAYRIIVINNDENQGFDKDSLTTYVEAHKNGLAQYIAAEIDPNVCFSTIFVGILYKKPSFYRILKKNS